MATPSYVPSESIRRTFAKAQGECMAILPQLEYWESLAQTLPEIDQTVTELRIKWESIAKLCRCALGQQNQPNTEQQFA